jgi:hypothetical protein
MIGLTGLGIFVGGLLMRSMRIEAYDNLAKRGQHKDLVFKTIKLTPDQKCNHIKISGLEKEIIGNKNSVNTFTEEVCYFSTLMHNIDTIHTKDAKIVGKYSMMTTSHDFHSLSKQLRIKYGFELSTVSNLNSGLLKLHESDDIRVLHMIGTPSASHTVPMVVYYVGKNKHAVIHEVTNNYSTLVIILGLFILGLAMMIYIDHIRHGYD